MHVGVTSVLCRYSIGFLPVLLAAPVWADSAPWHGAWTGDVTWCENADRIGSVTPAPVRLTATEFLGYENSCEITDVQDLEMRAWVITMQCQAEGEVYDERRLLMAFDDTLWMWGGAAEPTVFTRCPE